MSKLKEDVLMIKFIRGFNKDFVNTADELIATIKDNYNMSANEINALTTKKMTESMIRSERAYLKNFIIDNAKDNLKQKTKQVQKAANPSIIDFDISDTKSVQKINQLNQIMTSKYFTETDALDSFKQNIIDMFQEGLTKEEIDKKIKAEYNNLVIQNKNYIKALSQHISTTTRNLNSIDAFEFTGQKYGIVSAIIDSTTSAICKKMNGKKIPIKEMSKYKKRYLDIDSSGGYDEIKEQLETVSPFISDVEAENIGNEIGSAQYKKLGLAAPPYHFNCRTQLVIEN